MVLDRRFLDDGIGLQVGQVSQLGLADAMIAQAFHDAADFWVGSQSAVGSAQCTGSGRRWPAGVSRASTKRTTAAEECCC